MHGKTPLRKPTQNRNTVVSLFSVPSRDTQVKHVLHQSAGSGNFGWPGVGSLTSRGISCGKLRAATKGVVFLVEIFGDTGSDLPGWQVGRASVPGPEDSPAGSGQTQHKYGRVVSRTEMHRRPARLRLQDQDLFCQHRAVLHVKGFCEP